MKAIETRWKGYRFRSRLEARWAVFFERMGWRWEYEPQGFEKDGKKYLPDFRVHPSETLSYWVEVKGDPDWLRQNKSEIDWMHDLGGILPDFAGNGEAETIPNGLVILGQIPQPEFGVYFFPIIGHHKGTNLYWRCLVPEAGFYELKQVLRLHLGVDDELYSIGCAKADELDFQIKFARTPRGYPSAIEAITAARSARFEHGEAPAWS